MLSVISPSVNVPFAESTSRKAPPGVTDASNFLPLQSLAPTSWREPKSKSSMLRPGVRIHCAVPLLSDTTTACRYSRSPRSRSKT